MDITWYGHSCFSVLSGGETIVLDPFTGVDGYPDTAASAQRCLCSHEHFDHAFRQGVRLIPGPRAISVSRVETFHDDCQGALRAKNTVHILEA